jgi:hypothetical protein
MKSVRDDAFSAPATIVSQGRAARPSKGRFGLLRTCIYFGIGLVVFASVPAAAAPSSINDCEKIQEADAYNQCLASFGPVAHERGVAADPEGGANGPAQARASGRGHGGHRFRGRGHGHHASPHQSRHQDPWAHMRHPGGGHGARHRAEFKVK